MPRVQIPQQLAQHMAHELGRLRRREIQVISTEMLFIILDTSPKGRVHLLLLPKNGLGPAADALSPAHIPLIEHMMKVVAALKAARNDWSPKLVVGFHPPQHTSQGALHCHFVDNVHPQYAGRFASDRMVTLETTLEFLNLQEANLTQGDEAFATLFHATKPSNREGIIRTGIWKSGYKVNPKTGNTTGHTHGKGVYFAKRTACAMHKGRGVCVFKVRVRLGRCLWITDSTCGGREWTDEDMRQRGYDSLCVLCPGECSSPEFVLFNDPADRSAQKLIEWGIADKHGDVKTWNPL